MKRLVLFSLCVILWALATTANAATGIASDANAVERGFSYPMVGVAQLTDGTELPIESELSFARDERGWYFRVGTERVYRDTPPRAYNLNIILDGHNAAYILDFSEKPLQYLRLTVEGREIELAQALGTATQYGMRLRIDDRQFLFDSSHPRIRFTFNEQGLQTVSAENAIRDLSIRRVE